MDLAAHRIACFMYLREKRAQHLFRTFHFAAEGQYEKMIEEYLEYLYLYDEVHYAYMEMSFDQIHFLEVIMKGSQ